MNYKDDRNCMTHLTNMASNAKYYKDDIETLIYDIVHLVETMVPILVDERISQYQFDLTGFQKNIKDMFTF